MLDHDPTFSLQDAIRKQVEREDIVAWARRDIPLKALVSPLPRNDMRTWHPAALHTFAKQAIKRSISIMLP